MTATRPRSRSFLAVAALAASLAAAAIAASLGSSPAAAASGEQTIVKTAAQAGQFNTLLALAKKAGLVGALSGQRPAHGLRADGCRLQGCAKGDARQPREGPGGPSAGSALPRREGQRPAARIVTLKSTKTLAGPTIAIRAGKNVFLNRTTKVVKTDIGATNGTIHVINKVLLPPAK